MEGALNEIEVIGSRSGEMTGVPTGFANFGSLANGLHPAQVIVIALAVMHADRKICNLIAERRSIYNQVTELTNRIKNDGIAIVASPLSTIDLTLSPTS